MCIGLHVKYPSFLSVFNETSMFSTDFQKNINIKFHENPFSGRQFFHANRQTDPQKDRQRDSRQRGGGIDVTKLRVTFRNFENAPKKNCRHKHVFIKLLA
jgi:hypothetical protein